MKKAVIKNNKKFSTIEVLILVMLTLMLSFGAGFILNQKENKEKIKEDKYLEIFKENYDHIIESYYEDIDKNKLIENAIKGMVESLGDEYSAYMDGSESDTFDKTLNGSYQGVGVTIAKDEKENIVIIDIFKDSPADNADLKVMDIIKKVNDKEIKNMEPSDVTALIKKTSNKEFTLTVSRDGKEITKKIKTSLVTIKSVEYKLIEEDNKKIGYVSIGLFALNTGTQFKEAIKELEKSNIDSLIIDVRDNAGGHLVTAKEISSSLLDSKKVIYQTQGKDKKEKTYSTGKETKKYPIIFLANENTASGSEVLIGAVKDNIKETIIVGEKTYGKGTVQELTELNNNSQYKVTTKKWLTPNGTWIHKKGIKPDVEIKLSEEFMKNPKTENDNQLKKAMEKAKGN
jgi:C-terminal peptidase (prc)